MKTFTVRGFIVDLFNRDIFKGEIVCSGDRIIHIDRLSQDVPHQYIMPGFIDSHVHVESSMLTPSRFAELVVSRGTIATIADPHEIANVMGVEGINFMINDGKKVPFKFFFGAPSCVPATNLEGSGAILDPDTVGQLLKRDDIWFLSEMMNFPGVVNNDTGVMAKISAAIKEKKPVDGHAPGLRGERLDKYFKAGITTDHECASFEEAEEKIARGMKIQIREGSAAQNFNTLYKLFEKYPGQIMLCTDDSHPNDIIENGHIDKILRLGSRAGVDFFDLVSSATIVPALHYNVPVGLLRPGDPADFVVVGDLQEFNVLETYIDGKQVFNHKQGARFSLPDVTAVNNFTPTHLEPRHLEVHLPPGFSKVKVIEAIDGELFTGQSLWQPNPGPDRLVESDPLHDILKVVVVNRYRQGSSFAGFVKNFGLKRGAIGSSVAHDSHNMIIVGADDGSILAALHALVEAKGGIVTIDGSETTLLPLPVAGLMSDSRGGEVSRVYLQLEKKAHHLGSRLKAPFMTLSFLSLLVIPSLKISDKGLFDVNQFSFISLFEQ